MSSRWRNFDLAMMNEVEKLYGFFGLVSCHHEMTFYKLSILRAGGISSHFSLHVLDNMLNALKRLNSWGCDWPIEAPTHLQTAVMNSQTCVQSMSNTLHIIEIWSRLNLLERKPKTLRIERSKTCFNLDRAALKTLCSKLREIPVDCVKINIWHCQ